MECMAVNRSESVTGKSRLDEQKKYYKETFRFIDEALRLEDKGKQEEAVLCYKTSLRSISNGLKISVSRSDVSNAEYESFENIKKKLEKARQEVLHRLGVLNIPVNSSYAETANLSEQINEDVNTKSSTSNPEKVSLAMELDREDEMKANNVGMENSLPEPNTNTSAWHDTKELISIEEGVRLFYVHGRDVSTWASQCSLQVFQIIKENFDQLTPPAFLKCGEWLFPLEPAQSPILKTAHRTYMFPDIADNTVHVTDPSAIPCVGIILADSVPEALITRFERVLSLYSDFRKEALKPEDENPSQQHPSSKALEKPQASQKSKASPAVLSPDVDTIIAEPGIAQPKTIIDESRVSAALTKGIHIGSQWISWGFLKGSEMASSMVEKGSRSMQKRIKPNAESASVSPEVSRNIRQLHQTTGSVVQISSFVAATLGSLIVTLGKNLAPIVVQHGQKLLPDKYKVENNEKTQHVLDNAKKVAVAGLQGFSIVFLALEQSGKNLYQSIHKAAVETMHYKYGDEVGEVTNDAMGAAGNTAQVLWNVRKLGPKRSKSLFFNHFLDDDDNGAIAKRTAKETGKAIIDYDEQENPTMVHYHKNGTTD